jgi:FkbM family methyltransferase
MDRALTSRALEEIRAVCGSTSPTSAAMWLTSLVARLPACARARSLGPADRVWARGGATFRTANGAPVSLLPSYVLGAREMYCRNVYLRTGLTMPSDGWVVDLGANCGLFSVWAAVSGAQAVAVEAQRGFAPIIEVLAEHNGVRDRVHVEVAMVGGTRTSGSRAGVLSDDQRWSASSHGTPDRPADVSVPQLMAAHKIDHISLLKMDIEGGEFAVLATGEDLLWLECVRQIALEVHPAFGDASTLIERLRERGFSVDLRDNDGRPSAGTSPDLAYAYCSR